MSVYTVDGLSNEFGISPTQDGQGYVIWKGDWFEILTKDTKIQFNDKLVDPVDYTPAPQPAPVPSGEYKIDGDSADYGVGPTQDGKAILVWQGDWFQILAKDTKIIFNDKTVEPTDYTPAPKPAPVPTDEYKIDGDSADFGWGPTEDGQGIVVWKGDWFEILAKDTKIIFNDKTIDPVAPTPTPTPAPSDEYKIDGDSADFGWGPTEDGHGIVVWKGDWFEILAKDTKIIFNDKTIDPSDDTYPDPDPHPDPEPEPQPVDIGVWLKGDTTIMEGQKGTYQVKLDKAVSEDTWFVLETEDGTALRVDNNDIAPNQDIIWGGYYDIRAGVGGKVLEVIDDRVPNGTSTELGDRPQVGPDGKTIWDYTVEKHGIVQDGGVVKVLVKAGEKMSDAFDIQAWKEKVTIDRDKGGNEGAIEGKETFSLHLKEVTENDKDHFTVHDPYLDVTILDKTHYDYVSPITLDLNGDGEISVTGETSSKDKDANVDIGQTVEFDIDADGVLDSIEWIDGTGDALLVDMSKINTDGSIDGSALFGDEGGKFANGYEKLALLDENKDGVLTGDELSNLGLWIDDGDAKLEAGELLTAADAGLTSVSTEMEIIMDDEGRELMQSEAEVNGDIIMTEDVWFAEDLDIQDETMPVQAEYDLG